MTLGLALALLFTLAWVPLFLVRTQPLRDAFWLYTPSERLTVVGTPVAMSVHMTIACVMVSLANPVSPWRAALAISVFAAGMALWFWARAMISALRVRRLPDEPPLQLHRHGAFGIVRHPLYLSYLIAAAAPLVLVPRPVLGFTYALCAGAFAWRAVQEEHRLHTQVGPAYAAYCRQVKRLLPLVW